MLYLFLIEVQGVQVEELWSLDPEQFDNLKYFNHPFFSSNIKDVNKSFGTFSDLFMGLFFYSNGFPMRKLLEL